METSPYFVSNSNTIYPPLSAERIATPTRYTASLKIAGAVDRYATCTSWMFATIHEPAIDLHR